MKPTKQKLEKLYNEQNLGSHRIAKRLNVAKITVLRWLRQYNIPMRKGKEIHKYRGKDIWSKGGRVNHVSGYVRLWIPEKKNYEWEHKVVWEKYNGKISKGYHIHHKNGIKDDNRIENLEIISAKEHTELHRQKINNGIRKSFENGRRAWNKGLKIGPTAANKAWKTKKLSVRCRDLTKPRW